MLHLQVLYPADNAGTFRTNGADLPVQLSENRHKQWYIIDIAEVHNFEMAMRIHRLLTHTPIPPWSDQHHRQVLLSNCRCLRISSNLK
jgi:hypothetical protein